jgi:MoaA/NifB/PqqE/SkfB family radical SAM enzyme
MRSGFLPARVVHVHPTRACNLACAHCYSESAPGVNETLDVDLLIDGLARLRTEGYEIVSISGGEPLVYRPLDRLVAAATAQGYRVHMITNGVLLTERRLTSLAEHAFLIGVSLDGAEETHNAVRGRPDAFRHAVRALRTLSKAKVPFGIIYAVTAHSLPDVPWAFELAGELGASVFHLRPLAAEGRARSMAPSWTLGDEDCTRLFILAELLAAYGPSAPRVQVDLVAVDSLDAAREQFELLRPAPDIARLSDAVNPLIIDARGRCFPFVYGIDEGLELARLTPDASPDALRPNPAMLSRLTTLLDTAFREAGQEGVTYIDWFAHLTRVSRRMSVAAESHPFLAH